MMLIYRNNMSSINHETFVIILKYSTLSHLVKLVILSKECITCVQDEIDRKYLARSLIKPCISGNNHLFIPLQFWFNHNKGFALPLFAPKKTNFEF